MQYFLRNGTLKDLERVYPMLEVDFQDFERMPKRILLLNLMKGNIEFKILSDLFDREYGYAIMQTQSKHDFVLLAYVGIYPIFRGKKLATLLLDLLKEEYSNKRGILLEVTYAEGKNEKAEKLKTMYEKGGWSTVDVDYTLGGERATLMNYHMNGEENILPYVKTIIDDIYAPMVNSIPFMSITQGFVKVK